MLLRRKIFIEVSKLRGLKFENRLTAPFNVKSCYSNCPNNKFLGVREINGRHLSIPLCKKIPSNRYGMNMSQISEQKCWKCNEILKLKKFCCESCGTLQPPQANVNFFQLVGVSQTFDVDLDDLKKKFMNLQMMFHPDKFVNKSKEELEISESYSRLINKSYTILKDPVARGYYLLELQNISSEAFPLKQDFLITIMEENENLEAMENVNDLQKFLRKNQENVAEYIKLVNNAFRANHMDDVKLNLSKLNYFVKLDNKIKEKLHKLGSDLSV